MNKSNFLDRTNKRKLDLQDQDILKAVEEAKFEWERACEYFEMVNEPELIDYAIYLQHAARLRYMYLLNKAKKRGIHVGYYNILSAVNGN